jgi:hypothetical protein
MSCRPTIAQSGKGGVTACAHSHHILRPYFHSLLSWLEDYPLGTIDNYLIIHTTAIPLAARVDTGEVNDSFTVRLRETYKRSGNRLSFGSSCYMLVEDRVGA